jgi:hypothetical protein
MRYIIFITVLFAIGISVVFCNDPIAANYNVGFPGIADNTVCIYPRDLFVGKYLYRDSVYIEPSGLYVFTDSFYINILPKPYDTSKRKIQVTGFCGSTTLYLTAGPTYIATVDTLIGDTTTLYSGQRLCRIQDTGNGTITKDRIDSTVLHISFQVESDTGLTQHMGTAIKQ